MHTIVTNLASVWGKYALFIGEAHFLIGTRV